MRTMIILRAVPGAGKSTYAERFKHLGYKVFSTDDFWMQNGEYYFDHNKLHYAHVWNQNRVYDECLKGNDLVIDNTNVKWSETHAYLTIAMKNEYNVMFKMPPQIQDDVQIWYDDPKQGLNGWNVDVLYGRNVHGVPDGIIVRKCKEFQW